MIGMLCAMARRDPEVFTFRRDDTGGVVRLMDELAPDGGWIVLQPAFDADDAAPARGTGLFSGRGPDVPVCSWVPGERTRKGIEHVALGVEHGAGTNAEGRLAEVDVAVPDRWVVLQDNPKRGLVVAVPPHDEHGAVLGWLLDAGTALSAVRLSGEWRAFVHRR